MLVQVKGHIIMVDSVKLRLSRTMTQQRVENIWKIRFFRGGYIPANARGDTGHQPSGGTPGSGTGLTNN